MAEVEVTAPVAEANGHDSVLANGDVPVAAEADIPAVEDESEQPEPVSKGMYILRMPRPTFDEAPLKKLEVELSAVFTKLKAINNKSQTKRGEANELRKQLAVARSLRNGSSPEYDEKMTRLKQLREMRKSILGKITEMKSGRAGLECRTEEELDEKVAEMEHSIQHDGLTLNVEKQYVRTIAKLKSQREKIREVQNQQESLGQMEAEAKKIKAVIDEVDSEMNILRGERDQAKDIIDDLQKKLAAVTAVLADYDLERQDLETTKREIQEQIKTLREEIDNHMFEWRANRKLSLQLRDLVAEGKVEEAQTIAQQQVDSYLAKLCTDAAFRREYFKLWAEQRRYLVSELLPESGTVEPKPAAAAKGAKGAAAKRDAPLVPQGAAKAQAIIAAALADADAVVAAKKLAEPQPVLQEEPSTEEVDEADAEAAPAQPTARMVPGATDDLVAGSGKAPKSHKASLGYAKAMSEMPEVPDYEYIMPPPKQQTAEQLSVAEMKARVREEQRQKAAEAEARKKRRQEQLARKAAVAKQKAADHHASAAAAAATTATALTHRERAAPVPAAEELEGASGTDGEADAAEQQVVHQQKPQKGGGNKHLPAKAKQQLAAAAGKKPVIKKPAKVLKWHQQYSQELVIACFALFMLLLVTLWFTTK